jgi:hypothetical protein
MIGGAATNGDTSTGWPGGRAYGRAALTGDDP